MPITKLKRLSTNSEPQRTGMGLHSYPPNCPSTTKKCLLIRSHAISVAKQYFAIHLKSYSHVLNIRQANGPPLSVKKGQDTGY